MAKKTAAKKPAPKKAAPKPAPKPEPKPVPASGLKELQKQMEIETKTSRKNELTLGKRIEEIGSAGVKILNEVDNLRKAQQPKAQADRLAKAEKTVEELKAAVAALRKDVSCMSSESGLCNAGPLSDSFKSVDRKVASMTGDLESVRKAVRELGTSLAAKVDEIAAKFNLHSHFLQAKNWQQDLLFHLEPSVGTDKAVPLPDSNKPLMTRPARTNRDPAGFTIELRLTPPRHWDDPVIWFDNVGPVEKEEPKA